MPVNPNYVPSSGDGSHYNDDGSFTYPDGTVATLDEINTARQAKGMPPLGNQQYAGQDQTAGTFTDTNSPEHALGNAFGMTHGQADPSAPGASLNTSQGDDERRRLGPLLEQLQGQAQTGGGSWEQELTKATGQASSAASALGQSQPGVGYASELHNIGNAQSAIGQRAVGQGNILRAQSQQTAQNQLSDLLAGIGGQDASQAADSAAARQGTREANNAASGQASKTLGNTVQSAGQAAASLSAGGQVPGTPKIFGDDSRNDTVPAKLTPGEIVVPISHAGSPEDAEQFIRSLFASRGVRHFADGGTAWNEQPGNATGTKTVGSNLFGSGPQAPSIDNGGLLNTAAYDQNRAANLANTELLGKSAAGQGPSVAPQRMQNSSDTNIGAALAAMSGPRGGLPAGDVLQETGAAEQGAAGNAAVDVAGEQRQGQTALLHAILGQRARDQSLALAQQQAAFRNTQMNLGLDAAQQAAIRGITSGAGQGLAAYSAASSRDPGLSADSNSYASRGSPSDLSNGDEKWKGGTIGYADGGKVKEYGDTGKAYVGPAAQGKRSYEDQLYFDSYDGKEIQPNQLAVSPDEARRAKDFVEALKRSKGSSSSPVATR